MENPDSGIVSRRNGKIISHLALESRLMMTLKRSTMREQVQGVDREW